MLVHMKIDRFLLAYYFFFTERKFGDIERLSTASLTNGLTDKVFGTGSYNSPLGASYPPVKTSGQSSQSQKSLSLGEFLFANNDSELFLRTVINKNPNSNPHPETYGN